MISRTQQADYTTAPRIEFDACPCGYGILLKINDQVVKYMYGKWTPEDAQLLKVQIGNCAAQTVFEYLALFIALAEFGYQYRTPGIVVLGDNVASLTLSLNLKGDKSLNLISREIAWRRARQGWRYRVAHIPSEQNEVADALSRLGQPDRAQKPVPSALNRAELVRAPRLADLFVTL